MINVRRFLQAVKYPLFFQVLIKREFAGQIFEYYTDL
jgi:hypothetical protein